jgi:molybdopterin converting factor small subunit
MFVHIRLSEPYWRTVGQRNFDLEMEDGNRVNDLVSALCNRSKGLAQELEEAPPVIFIDEVEASMETELSHDSHVHLVWPIAGG